MEVDGEAGVNKEPLEDDGGPNVKFWVSQIAAAKKAAKPANDLAKEAWEEYVGGDPTSPKKNNNTQVRYPVYWSSVNTIQPALYSRTPITVAEKAFDNLPDNVARLGSLCLERLAKYLLSKCPFDRVQYATRDTYIHCGKATNRVFFEGEVKETVGRKKYKSLPLADGTGTYYDDKGLPPPEGAELIAEEDGTYTLEELVEEIEKANVVLIPIDYRDILHTPNARHEDEITWKSFKNLMTRQECADRFGDKASEIKYSTTANKGDSESKKDDLPMEYACIWEIWDKTEEKVYWLDDGSSKEFLDIKDDPYELDGFFPCPAFILGTTSADNMYAVPDHYQLSSLLNQLHGMARRLQRLVRASRRRGLFDSNVTELSSLATDTDEGEYIGVKNFEQNIVGKGGLDNVVQHFPTQEIVDAIQEMVAVMNVYEERVNQMWGIPDILRGVSDPDETAAAQQLKGKFLSLRFSAKQREFQRLIRDDIELMCDLALKKYPEFKLREIMGAEFMDQEEQLQFPAVLALLQNDQERKLRISIETDSTITMNEVADIEQRNYLAKSLFEGLQAVGGMTREDPTLKPLLYQTMLYQVRGIRDGKEIEGTLETALNAMLQQGQEPQQQGPPPEPDHKPQEMQIQQMKIQMDGQIAQGKLQLQSAELQIKGQQLQVEFQKIAQSAGSEQQKNALLQQAQQFDQYLETMKLDLEKARVQLDMEERYMTEDRLEREFKQKDAEIVHTSNGQQTPAVTNINVVPGAGLI